MSDASAGNGNGEGNPTGGLPAGNPPTNPPAKSDDSKTSDDWKAPASQAELDRIIQDRLNRERSKYADYTDLKTKAAKFDELDAASKSELEKAQNRATELEARATAAEERAKTNLLRAAVVAEASTQKAVSPEDVYALLDKNSLSIDDDGNVVGVRDAVTALLAEKTFLKGNGFTGSADAGSRTNGSNPATYSREQLLDHDFYLEHKADILRAQREGRILQ